MARVCKALLLMFPIKFLIEQPNIFPSLSYLSPKKDVIFNHPISFF